MLREILKALRGTDALTEMIGQFGQMLQAGEWMFHQASDVLMRQVDWAAAAEGLYARDRQINEIERTIRKQILTHLSVGNTEDLSGCLVLMSVVKDAERIGDYCKNIFEIGKFYRREFTHAEYAEPLDRIRSDLAPLFSQAETAFAEADAELARKTLDEAGRIGRRCNEIIQKLLTTADEMLPDEAVAYVLMARFYKRVAAHLANIATSVLSPVPMLDYRGEVGEPEA